ncbi:transcriptional regulator of acetoin/glycerol metabolism [Branchiibius hedensis]|uniref:Transcriptional regulator of acetoin/glycerol metabolism n=1 Tax=Branchiibius hedensis TaxID=672460 RepID=A0A2Y8ZQR9_9MICO|nr:helix-turn-helix domain-containing protein [Branchiibius hedensis]PWJ24862.1 transcriptional regulator of acetoin/glycerol metabolism [Branchiibius hedensis]SSA33678.1 Transcriptional regulator of acetoin/glycerol metabolism [Branchiibius hedensis]
MVASDPVREAREALQRAGLLERQDAPSIVPEVIERSWRRSISHAVGSDRVSEDHRDVDPESTLYRAAAPVLDRWQEQLSETPMTLFLSDRVGRIVARRLGARDQASRLDEVHAAEGFVFSEETMGTNGLGTALAENQAVLISGSQHFNDLLAPITCAAVPVAAPGGSVLGSVSLGGPVAEGSQLMLSLTAEIGRQIETRLRAESRPEDLALAMSFMRYKNSRRPTVVVDQHSLLANTPALPFVSVDSHVLLWELMKGHDWRRSPTAEIVLPDGIRVVGRRLDSSTEPQFVAHFFDVNLTETLAQERAVMPAIEPARVRAPRSDAVMVEGPAGSGRFKLALEIVSSETMDEPVTAVAADDADWAEVAEAALTHGRDVVLRRVENLGAGDAEALTTLVRTHQRSVGRGQRTSRLVLTLAPDDAPAAIRELAKSLGLSTTRIAPLRASPDRIPGLVRSVLGDVDPSGRFTVTASALQSFMQYDWPGELRELRRLLQDLVANAPSAVIDSRQLPEHLRRGNKTRQMTLIETAERDAIVRALDLAGGNKSTAAELLGIGRTTLYRRLRQLHIEGDEASL